MKLRVAGLQMSVADHDVSANVARITDAIRQASAAGAELLLTPEGSLSGYHAEFDEQQVKSALAEVTACAKAARVGLVLGTCFREDDGAYYNQLRFYRPDGVYLGFHAKTLLCSGIRVPRPTDEINKFARRDLRVFEWAPGLTVGGLICNDMWANPEYTSMPDTHLAQQLAGRGVRVIFHAVNGGRDGSEVSRTNWQYHEANLVMRARAGNVWIVTVDNACPESLDCSSPSGVVSPSGQWISRAPARGAHLFMGAIDLGVDGNRSGPNQ